MASERLNILFIATEVEDLAKTGGLADVAKALPQALSAHMPLDLVILMLGTNDVKARFGASAEAVRATALQAAALLGIEAF